VTGDLTAVTAIERLKAQYCRTLDTKRWDEFRQLFADDFVNDTTEAGGALIEGADAFVEFVQRVLRRAVTVHQVQQPEIDLTSPSTATGVWAMLDVVRFAPGITLHGFGHYHETYENVGGRWVIKSSKLTRLREEVHTPLVTVFVSGRLRRVIHRAATRFTGL
jgi:hypothetical protein